jgi:hypothetical protein
MSGRALRRQKTAKLNPTVNLSNNGATPHSRCTNRFALLSFYDDTDTHVNKTHLGTKTTTFATTIINDPKTSAEMPLNGENANGNPPTRKHHATTESKDQCRATEPHADESSPGNSGPVFCDVAKASILPPTYKLIMGNEPIQKASYSVLNNAVDRVASDALLHDLSMSSIHAGSFFGKCFECQYMSHSQKYCPLRLCNHCLNYGHAEITCPSKPPVT